MKVVHPSAPLPACYRGNLSFGLPVADFAAKRYRDYPVSTAYPESQSSALYITPDFLQVATYGYVAATSLAKLQVLPECDNSTPRVRGENSNTNHEEFSLDS